MISFIISLWLEPIISLQENSSEFTFSFWKSISTFPHFSFDILFCLNMTDQIAIIKNFCVLFSTLPLELWQIRLLSQYLFFLMYFPFYQYVMSLFSVTIFLLSLSFLILAQPPQLSFGYYFHFITISFPVFHFFKNWGCCGL